MTDIWTGNELDEYVIEGYNALAMATGCFWATDVAPDLPFAFNYTQKFEFEFFVGGDLVSGLAQFTSEFERDWVDNSDGPANHSHHWEFNDGHVDEEGLPTEISALVDLPLDLYEIERAVWNTRRIDAQRTRHFESDDHRYELSKGPVDAYMQDKDGLRRLRKWRVPSVPYEPYSVDRVPPYSDSVIASLPTAYWRFGEDAGLIAEDSSGNGLHGVYLNFVTLMTLGIPGAIRDDPDTAVSLPTSSFFQKSANVLFDTGNTLSVEFWIRWDGISDWAVSKGNAAEVWSIQSVAYLGYQAVMLFSQGVQPGNPLAISSQQLPIGVWTYVVITKDGSDLHIYFNDEDVTIVNVDAVIPSTSGVIQANTLGSTPLVIDDLAIYGRALSFDEVLGHYSDSTISTEYGILIDVSDIDDDTPIGEWGDFVQVGGQHMMGDPWGVICAIYKETSNMRYEYRRRGTGDCDDLELPERYQVYVRHYAQARANEREGDGQDLELAEHYMARFREGVARMLKRRQAMHYQQKYILGGGRTERSRPVWRMPWAYGRRVR